MSWRKHAITVTQTAGTILLARSLKAEPDSRRFYRATYATAATWTAGGLAIRPARIGRRAGEGVAVGAAAFGVFYVGAHVARRIPVLRRALKTAFAHVHVGNTPVVAATTVANGIAEEIYFRGALQDAVGPKWGTAMYVGAVSASGNPALVLAAVIMGSLLAWERERGDGLLAPTAAHVTWSVLMLRYVAPLFKER